jgi:hypothetical protein
MRALFFQAAVENPNAVQAVMGQADQLLRPFNRFLGQAIHTAKQRQFRYQLPWERVQGELTLRLTPADSRLRVSRARPGLLLVGGAPSAPPDLSKKGFITNRDEPVIFEAAIPTAAGLRVQTDAPLTAGDQVIWCGQLYQVAQDGAPAPPVTLTDLKGRALRLCMPPQVSDEQRFWIVVVEGQHTDGELIVDGEPVMAEALDPYEGLREVTDDQHRAIPVSQGAARVSERPSGALLTGNNGLRYRWSAEEQGRAGCWVQLLPPESAADDQDFLDPRAAFCEGDVQEVWTQARHSPQTSFRVRRVDQDRYQLLLDRYPPQGSTLFLPIDLRNLYLQRRALRQLMEAPLPHHRGLLRLCESPQDVRWPSVQPVELEEQDWQALRDVTRDGTEEQRDFVSRALGSPDFALLEGPPGSGKTTAICELILQLVQRGQRVLLCASTHVAIDNVLERLLVSSTDIDAVRIGKADRVDERVLATQIDARVEALLAAWERLPAMSGLGTADLHEMAERAVVMASNLTCGTTMGIVNHPLFRGRDRDAHASERPISTMPHWDVLIIDEASKTLIQEFMVPALMARRWIIVGDVRQLPPFADRADLVANLRDLVDEKGQPLFPADHQRACLLLYRLTRRQLQQPGLRWLLVERPGVLECIDRELTARPRPALCVVQVVSDAHQRPRRAVAVVTLAQLRQGAPEALLVAGADWVLVADDLIRDVAPLLPPQILIASDLEPAPHLLPLRHRQLRWLERARPLEKPFHDRQFRNDEVKTLDDAQLCERDWLQRHDLAQELAWRLTRLQELRRSRNRKVRDGLQKDLPLLMPAAAQIEGAVQEIQDIGLPSILEVLQEGIGAERASRRGALTEGLRSQEAAFEARFQSLSFQHRMHADIAAFSREIIYDNRSLRDANTIQARDAALGWDFGPFPARRAWVNLQGREQSGVNGDEIRAMRVELERFIAWARGKGAPARALPDIWEVACLCFYVKQEGAISEMLRELTGDNRRTRFQVTGAPVEIVCGTVDRFQGREADLVLLSMRNTRRVGFLDSPNRLNVALTRARQQLLIFGNADYFRHCGADELEQLAARTQQLTHNAQTHTRRSR